MHLGEKLKKYRIENNITQQKLSELLNVSRSNIAEIERGKIKGTVKFISKLSTVTDIPMNYWTGSEDNGSHSTASSTYASLDILLEAMIDTGAITEEGTIVSDRDKSLILSVLEKEIKVKLKNRK